MYRGSPGPGPSAPLSQARGYYGYAREAAARPRPGPARPARPRRTTIAAAGGGNSFRGGRAGGGAPAGAPRRRRWPISARPPAVSRPPASPRAAGPPPLSRPLRALRSARLCSALLRAARALRLAETFVALRRAALHSLHAGATQRGAACARADSLTPPSPPSPPPRSPPGCVGKERGKSNERGGRVLLAQAAPPRTPMPVAP